jgi:dTDP-4-dehydrorhamnose 3,5-epimerase
VFYQVSQVYSAEHASGVRYNDPAFSIQWPLVPTVMSQNDKTWPAYKL